MIGGMGNRDLSLVQDLRVVGFFNPDSALKSTGSATHLFTKPAVQKGVWGTTGKEKCTGISIASWLWDR